MILIDPRRGSGELAKFFQPYDITSHLAGPDCSFKNFCFLDDGPDQLPFGDFCFWGNGPEGMVLNGFERKVLSDMVSSMRNNRLSGYQLGGMLELYHFPHIIVEGIWQCGSSGLVEVPRNGGWETYYIGKKALSYRELDHFIATMQYKRGVIFERTANKGQTAAYIVSRYKWFNDKTWPEHRSDEVLYAPFNPVVYSGSSRVGFTRRTVPKVEKMIAQLDGFDRASYSIAKRWKNAEKLVEASEKELAETQIQQIGKKGSRMVRLGDVRAKSLYSQLRED